MRSIARRACAYRQILHRLRYDSRSGTHNMYREYRDTHRAGAVTQCCMLCLRLWFGYCTLMLIDLIGVQTATWLHAT